MRVVPRKEKLVLNPRVKIVDLTWQAGRHQIGVVRLCFGSTAQTVVKARPWGGETQAG